MADKAKFSIGPPSPLAQERDDLRVKLKEAEGRVAELEEQQEAQIPAQAFRRLEAERDRFRNLFYHPAKTESKLCSACNRIHADSYADLIDCRHNALKILRTVAEALKLGIFDVGIWLGMDICDCLMEGVAHFCGKERVQGNLEEMQEALAEIKGE